MIVDYNIPDHIQKQVDNDIPPLDIIHGELKNKMLEAEEHLNMCIDREEKTEEAINSMDRTYAEGFLDALISVYDLTYQLSFATEERDGNV